MNYPRNKKLFLHLSNHIFFCIVICTIAYTTCSAATKNHHKDLQRLQKLHDQRIYICHQDADCAQAYKKALNTYSPTKKYNQKKHGPFRPFPATYSASIEEAAQAVGLSYIPCVFVSQNPKFKKQKLAQAFEKECIISEKILLWIRLNEHAKAQKVLRHECLHLLHKDTITSQFFAQHFTNRASKTSRNIQEATKKTKTADLSEISEIIETIHHEHQSYIKTLTVYDTTQTHRKIYTNSRSIRPLDKDFYQEKEKKLEELASSIKKLKHQLYWHDAVLIQETLNQIDNLLHAISRYEVQLFYADYKHLQEKRADLEALWTFECYACVKEIMHYFKHRQKIIQKAILDIKNTKKDIVYCGKEIKSVNSTNKKREIKSNFITN